MANSPQLSLGTNAGAGTGTTYVPTNAPAFGDLTPGFNLGISNFGTGVTGALIGHPNVPGAPIQIQQSKTNPTVNRNTSTSTGTTGTTGTSGTGSSYTDQLFSTQIAGLQAQLAALDPQNQANQLQLQQQYQDTANSLQKQLGTGQAALNTSQHQIDFARAQSLHDIAHNFNQLLQGYNNQLGAYGAGDSSAAQMLGQALGGQASRSRSDVVQNASNQTNAVEQQQRALQDNFDTQTAALNNWKSSQLLNLAQSYQQQKANIQAHITDAAAQQAALSGLTQNAVNYLSQLQTTYQNEAQKYADTLKNVLANPNINVDPSLQKYEVAPITAGQIQGLTTPTNAQQTDNTQTLALLKKLQEQQQPLYSLGG